MAVVYIFLFILGLSIGSFLNVIIYRTEKEKSFLKGRSFCIFCKKKLEWYELIPLISFFVQRGRCLKCKKKISWQYPLVEFFTGLVFLLIGIYFFEFNVFSIINTCFLLIVSCFLILIFIYDLKHYLIPDKFVYPVIILVFAYQLILLSVFNQFLFISHYILSGLIGGAFFLIFVLVSRGKWMGLGDVKLGILMGLFLGVSGLITALFLAFFVGAVVSVFLMIFQKKSIKSEIPFGPFLIGATFVSLIWGNVLIDFYLSLFQYV